MAPAAVLSSPGNRRPPALWDGVIRGRRALDFQNAAAPDTGSPGLPPRGGPPLRGSVSLRRARAPPSSLCLTPLPTRDPVPLPETAALCLRSPRLQRETRERRGTEPRLGTAQVFSASVELTRIHHGLRFWMAAPRAAGGPVGCGQGRTAVSPPAPQTSLPSRHRGSVGMRSQSQFLG